MYEQFLRRSVRNLLAGTALSTLPAAAFYFFVFPYTERQLMVLLMLGTVDLLAFLPLDIAILRWSMAPVRRALWPDATYEEKRRGMARLLDSPLLVIARVYGPHAIAASAGITVLVVLANRYLELGIDPATFPLYWVLNLTVIPVAHVVYEFAAMERALQPLARELALSVRASEAQARRFTLEQRMRIFFPLLALAPIAVVSVSIFLRTSGGAQSDPARLVRDLVAIGGACAVLFLYLMYTLGGQVRTQTQQLIASLDRLGRGDLTARAELYSTSEFGEIAAHVDDMALSLSERQRLRDLFGAYMTDEVATALLARGDEADRTEKRYVAVLFVDVRGFTAFSRERAPEVIVEVLNRFFEAAVGAVAEHKGTVNKYLGDGLLAIFGAPVELENPCASAIAAALEMTERVGEVNRALAAEGVPEMRVGIGIHAGDVVVGSIGAAKHKLEYTVIGDPVNVASRIEQLNKPLGTEILVSEEALAAAGADWRAFAGEPASEQVKGIEKPVTVYPIQRREVRTAQGRV